MKRASTRAKRLTVSAGDGVAGQRVIAVETPIAFTYNRATYAVMMATPANLEDFAIGFSLSERIVASPDEIVELETIELERGIELRMTLAQSRAGALEQRRRRIAGPAGCGLCGIESLDAAVAPAAIVECDVRVPQQTVFRALKELASSQPLNAETRAVHAAGFWSLADNRFVAVREDIGRHNALDKLIGALARSPVRPQDGFIVMTSRLSIELVQKACAFGTPLLAAISAPTSFAIEAAEAANLTLVAVGRDDSFEIFTHPQRIAVSAHVA
jgi:FdhD protein